MPHPYITIDAQRDVETLDGEFLPGDLVMVEKRLEKLQADVRIRGKAVDKAVPRWNSN